MLVQDIVNAANHSDKFHFIIGKSLKIAHNFWTDLDSKLPALRQDQKPSVSKPQQQQQPDEQIAKEGSEDEALLEAVENELDESMEDEQENN